MVLIFRDRLSVQHSFSSFSQHLRMYSYANLPVLTFHLNVFFFFFFCSLLLEANPELIATVTDLAPRSAVIHMKLWERNFSLRKVWMWHEMRYGSRPNWYLIKAWPGWRVRAHLLRVSSNMHDLLATANFSRDKKHRGREASGKNAVNLHIFHEKHVNMPYISCIRQKALKNNETSKEVIRRYSTLFKSFCVSAMTRLWIFVWSIYEPRRIQTSLLVWGSWVVGRLLLFFKGSCLFNEGAL